MNIQDIYELIGKKIWSIFPTEASSINYYAQIFDEHYEYSVDFLVNEEIKWFEFGQLPKGVCEETIELLKLLGENDLFSQRWTHCIITINNEGEFKINFSYIPEEDSWSGIYLKGVSDLTLEESEEYFIPLEIWKDRVNRKEEIYAKYTNLKGN